MPHRFKVPAIHGLIWTLSVIFPMSAYAECFSTDTARVEETRRTVDRDDPEEMNRWNKLAVDANNAAAIHRLGRISIARQDVATAYRMFERGARLGDYQSMFDLGIMWLKGEGRDIDPSKAYGWYLLSGEYIPTDWGEDRIPAEKIKWHKALAGDLEKKMTPEQIEAGKAYYEEQKKTIVCDWYGWYKGYLKSTTKRP